MSDASDLGVVYTEQEALRAGSPLASLWSYDTRVRGHERRRITLNADGSREYWLEPSDPLLNTILPGTAVSLVVNVGDDWAAGRSRASSALLPRICVVGPVTQSRILNVGRSVRAFGAVVAPTLSPSIFGVPACELVDRIVPLDHLWSAGDVEQLIAAVSHGGLRRSSLELKKSLMNRLGPPTDRIAVERSAVRMITQRGGRVSIDAMAKSHGLGRRQFARRFSAAAGLTPKLFARITRFQALVHALLSTDAAEWASLSSAVGFYDQAHMINEFRDFAGAPPTIFFQPHGVNVPEVTCATSR